MFSMIETAREGFTHQAILRENQRAVFKIEKSGNAPVLFIQTSQGNCHVFNWQRN